MSTSQDRETNKLLSKKLRSACDICHQAKMKCSGGTPCQGCRSSDHECIYSVSKRIGRPKGTKNKRTADRVGRQQSEKERKNHKNEHGSQVAPPSPAPGQISRAKPQTLSVENGTGQRPAMMESTSIDTLLRSASNIPYSLPGSEGHGQLANNMSPWYNFGELAETSPLKLQSSLASSFAPIRSFSNSTIPQYHHNDSAYVSPASVFGEVGSVALVSASPSAMNPVPSMSSPSLFPLPEYNCFAPAHEYPAASQAPNRRTLSHDSALSFPPQSRLSYPA